MLRYVVESNNSLHDEDEDEGPNFSHSSGLIKGSHQGKKEGSREISDIHDFTPPKLLLPSRRLALSLRRVLSALWLSLHSPTTPHTWTPTA